MNKYFIGLPVPADLVPSLLRAQKQPGMVHLLDATPITKQEDFHITLLYIGKASVQQAKDLMLCTHGLCALELALGPYEVFTKKSGPHALVLKTYHHMGMSQLTDSLRTALGGYYSWPFNPHITLAKTDTVDFGMPAACASLNDSYSMDRARFTFNQIVLYEKPEGGEYHPLMVYDLSEEKT